MLNISLSVVPYFAKYGNVTKADHMPKGRTKPLQFPALSNSVVKTASDGLQV